MIKTPLEPASIHSLQLNKFSLFSPLQNAEVSVFEVNIRFIGGLLAAYYLSGQEVSLPNICATSLSDIVVFLRATPGDTH